MISYSQTDRASAFVLQTFLVPSDAACTWSGGRGAPSKNLSHIPRVQNLVALCRRVHGRIVRVPAKFGSAIGPRPLSWGAAGPL